MSISRTRIFGAFIVGIALVLGAFLLSSYQRPTATAPAELAVVERAEVTREFIITTDHDGDGIPDWQEALQRTEPVELGDATSTYTVPDTLTDRFAIEFFQEMVRSENIGAFGSNPEELAEFATDAFADQAEDVLFTRDDITILSNNSLAAQRAYANEMAQIVLDNQIPGDYPNEVEILRRAYETNDPEVLKELDLLIDGYTNLVNDSKATPVPESLVKEHLDLINVYNAILTDITAMSMAFSDPLLTIIRLKRYEQDAASLAIVALNLYRVILAAGVTFEPGDPAATLIPQN